jgi:hypothetical protein
MTETTTGQRLRWVAGILLLVGGMAAVAVTLPLPSSWVPWQEQQSKLASKVEGQSASPMPVPRPVYTPPKLGAPSSGRVAGGTRGVDLDRPVLLVLVPDHTGLTVHAQPTLYWYVSQPINRPISVKITSDSMATPLLDTTILPPIPAGILALPLAQYATQLVTGVHYQWGLELATDPTQPSSSLWSSGAIEREAPSPEFLAKLDLAAPSDQPALYAKEGLWYDALDSLSAFIQVAPDDLALRQHRASLLEQVGLHEPAAQDLRR